MSVWYDKTNLISLQYGTSVLGVVIVKLVNPTHLCTVSNLHYVQYSMLCGLLCFELFKITSSALRFINVRISAHCMLSATMFISHPAVVAKTQQKNFENYGINLQRYLLTINNWYEILAQLLQRNTMAIQKNILCPNFLLKKTISRTWNTTTFAYFGKISKHKQIILYLLPVHTVKTR